MKPISIINQLLAVMFFMGTSLSKNTDGPPIIKEHPKDLLSRRNDPATLNCASPNADTFEWYRNGELVLTDDSKEQRIITYDGSLYFMRVMASRKENDAGIYWCVATNEFGSTKSRNATLTIASLGTIFIQEPKASVKVKQGESLTLHCRPPKGVPGPTVTWKHNGITVSNNSRVRMSKEGDLLFDDVVETDAGVYVCVAHNFVGPRESSQSSVVVLSPPWFEERPKNLSTNAGATVEFNCGARGTPKPSVTWRRLDGKMPLERTQKKGENTLRISEVSVSDSGMYVCEAKNEAGSAMTLASLKVVVAPELKEKPGDSLSIVGENLILKCKVEGDPSPLIVWKLPHRNENILLTGGKNNNHVSVSQNGSFLIVNNLKIDDSGSYDCLGISSGGGVSSRSEVVVVQSLPPPLIGIRPQDQHAEPGSSISFPCEVASEASDAKIVWWFQKAAHLPAQQLSNKRTITQLQTGTLKIKQISAEDAGIYKCRASSKSGSIEVEAILKVTENAKDYEDKYSSSLALPAPPSKPRITFYNGTSIHLTWLPNSRGRNKETEFYKIEYWRAPWQEWRVAKAEVSETSSIIGGLTPNTAYIFLIRTVNEIGESFPSPWSDMIYTSSEGSNGVSLEEERKIRRKLNKPSVALLSAKASSSSSAILTWELLEGIEMELDGVIVYSVADDASIETATVMGVSSKSHTLQDLRPNTQYNFFLIPFLRTIEGVPSNSKSLVTPEEAPDVAPTGISVEVFDSGTTLVKWEPLKKSEARGNVIGYRVFVSHNRTETIKETQNPWLEVQDLVEGRLYTIKISAVTGGGVGPWSPPELINIAGIPPVGRQDSDDDNEDVPSVFYAPPHPVWLLYLLVPIIIFLIIVSLLYLRKIRRKSTSSSIDAQMGPTLYSSTGVYGPTHQVNMYGEQKLWRPTDSDQDSSLSSARLLRPEHLANEYAEPRIQRLSDAAEPYATTALLAPASPRNDRTPSAWRHGRCAEDIQVNWSAWIPPPPTCPPPRITAEGGDTCSSATTSESGERRHYHTGSSSHYDNNGGGSEQYERPCDSSAPCDLVSEHTYAVYVPVPQDGSHSAEGFQTFSTLQANPYRNVKTELLPTRGIQPPKSNTH